MTTDSYELPPLPEGDVDTPMLNEAWTADQMREYALLAVKAERERCIAACEKVSKDLDEYAEKYNYHGDAWSYIEQCVAAIRKG